MLSLIFVILIMVGLFKLTGLMFRIAGHLIGAILGIFGWLILAGLAVTLFGLALYALPVILGIGVVSLIAEA
jgi:hypothetical protein